MDFKNSSGKLDLDLHIAAFVKRVAPQISLRDAAVRNTCMKLVISIIFAILDFWLQHQCMSATVFRFEAIKLSFFEGFVSSSKRYSAVVLLLLVLKTLIGIHGVVFMYVCALFWFYSQEYTFISPFSKCRVPQVGIGEFGCNDCCPSRHYLHSSFSSIWCCKSMK